MSRTARAVFVDGEMIGYLPVTNAENVEYGNTNVKLALDNKVSKSGDTMSGLLRINTGSGESHLALGGAGSNGVLELISGTNNKVNFILSEELTENRATLFPNKGGTVALTSDFGYLKENQVSKVVMNNSVSLKGFQLTIPSITYKGYVIQFYHRYGYTLALIQTDYNGHVGAGEVTNLIGDMPFTITNTGNVVSIQGDPGGWNTFLVIVTCVNNVYIDLNAIGNSITEIQG